MFLAALRNVLSELEIGPELSCIEEWASVWELWATIVAEGRGRKTSRSSVGKYMLMQQAHMEAKQRIANAYIGAGLM